MRKCSYWSFEILWLLILFMWGCAGSSPGGREKAINYSTNVGIATTYDFQQISERILNKYQYQVDRQEEFGERLYIQTEWKDRQPFADERAVGVVATRSRLILQTKPRIRGGYVVKLNQVQFIGENLVKYSRDDRWQTAPLTPMCRDYFKRCANDLKTEFDTIFRRYQ